MAKVKLNLRGLSTLEIIDLGRRIVRALTGNPAFPNPQPSLATLTAGIDDLETALGNLDRSKQEVATNLSIRDDKQAAAVALLRQSAAFVEALGGDDDSVILSAGMEVRSAASPSQAPAAPGDLSTSEGDHEGEIDLHWNKSKGGKSYEIQRSLDPPTATSWQHAAVSAKSSATISGLISGTRYWFRVAAITSAGQSGWSDPATKIAP